MENSGRDPIIMPLLGKGLNTLIGEETVDSVYKNRKEIYKDLLKLDKENFLLEEDKKSVKALIESGFLSDEEKNILTKDLFKNQQDIVNKRDSLMSIIKEHLDKNDPFSTNKK
jgi:hypothetical protein